MFSCCVLLSPVVGRGITDLRLVDLVGREMVSRPTSSAPVGAVAVIGDTKPRPTRVRLRMDEVAEVGMRAALRSKS